VKIRLVLFDIDDTLLPTTETFWAALEEVVRARYGAEAPDALETVLRLLHFFGTNEYRGFLRALCAERGLQGDALALEHEALCRTYKEAYARRIRPREGAHQALEELVAEGRLLGVISNGRPRFQKMKLDRAGLLPFFRGPVLVSGDFPPGFDKPSPRLFEEALSRVGVPAGAAAFVGDRTADVIGANLAGLWVLRYLTPEQPAHPVALRTATPHATVTRVAEIPGALRELERRAAPPRAT
jgi:HAD superfamily hydrolase (TIGR01549 family)